MNSKILLCEFKPCKRPAIAETCMCGAYACRLHFKRGRDFCDVCKPAWGPSKELHKKYNASVKKKTVATAETGALPGDEYVILLRS